MMWVLLWTTSKVQAQFEVRPMRLAWTAVAGETIEAQIDLINRSPYQAQVLIKIVDLGQNAQGQWLPAEESASTSSSALEYPKASCRSWINLTDPVIPVTTVSPIQEPHTTPTPKTLRFYVDVPTTSTGSHLAALKIRFQTTGSNRSTTMHLDYVIPVVVEVVPAQSQMPALGLKDMVTDITLTPSSLSRQARPGQVLPLILQLHNRHLHQFHTARVSDCSDMTDASGRTYGTWIHDLSMSPVTVEPNDVNSLKLEFKIPDDTQGCFDSTVTVLLNPQASSHLRPTLACVIPIHLDITTSDEPRTTVSPLASSLRIINPRPFEVQRRSSGNQILGTLAVYCPTPVYLQGSDRNSPWHLKTEPNLIQSYPLAGLYGEIPSWDPNDKTERPPAILTLRPARP